MKRSQLNINIAPELLGELKGRAMMSGKTLSSYITEIIVKKLTEEEESTFNYRLNTMEIRLNQLESKIGIVTLSKQKETPFTTEEAQRCTAFIKDLFTLIAQKKCFSSKKSAWDDFLPHVTSFDQWNNFHTLRLQEVLFIEDGEPLTAQELNALTKGKECPCPIRTGFINWISQNKKGVCSCSDLNFPSQQEICNEGVKLLDRII